MEPSRQPAPNDTLLAALRRSTSAAHAELDAALALSTETITFARYEAFLVGTERVVRRVEPIVARVLGDGDASARSDRLERDLARLGRRAPACRALLPTPNAEQADAWGMAYVIEGSTLGGLVLAGRVESALGLDEGDGTSFLRLRGNSTGARWRHFLASLEAFGASASPSDHARCCASADSLFREYAESFRHSGAIS